RVAASSVTVRFANSRVIRRIRSNSSSVSAWPQNDNPLPIVTGIAWGSLLASLHAYATEIFRKSPAKSFPVSDQLHCANGQSPAKAYGLLLKRWAEAWIPFWLTEFFCDA